MLTAESEQNAEAAREELLNFYSQSCELRESRSSKSSSSTEEETDHENAQNEEKSTDSTEGRPNTKAPSVSLSEESLAAPSPSKEDTLSQTPSIKGWCNSAGELTSPDAVIRAAHTQVMKELFQKGFSTREKLLGAPFPKSQSMVFPGESDGASRIAGSSTAGLIENITPTLQQSQTIRVSCPTQAASLTSSSKHTSARYNASQIATNQARSFIGVHRSQNDSSLYQKAKTAITITQTFDENKKRLLGSAHSPRRPFVKGHRYTQSTSHFDMEKRTKDGSTSKHLRASGEKVTRTPSATLQGNEDKLIETDSISQLDNVAENGIRAEQFKGGILAPTPTHATIGADCGATVLERTSNASNVSNAGSTREDEGSDASDMSTSSVKRSRTKHIAKDIEEEEEAGIDTQRRQSSDASVREPSDDSRLRASSRKSMRRAAEPERQVNAGAKCFEQQDNGCFDIALIGNTARCQSETCLPTVISPEQLATPTCIKPCANNPGIDSMDCGYDDDEYAITPNTSTVTSQMSSANSEDAHHSLIPKETETIKICSPQPSTEGYDDNEYSISSNKHTEEQKPTISEGYDDNEYSVSPDKSNNEQKQAITEGYDDNEYSVIKDEQKIEQKEPAEDEEDKSKHSGIFNQIVSLFKPRQRAKTVSAAKTNAIVPNNTNNASQPPPPQNEHTLLKSQRVQSGNQEQDQQQSYLHPQSQSRQLKTSGDDGGFTHFSENIPIMQKSEEMSPERQPPSNLSPLNIGTSGDHTLHDSAITDECQACTPEKARGKLVHDAAKTTDTQSPRSHRPRRSPKQKPREKPALVKMRSFIVNPSEAKSAKHVLKFLDATYNNTSIPFDVHRVMKQRPPRSRSNTILGFSADGQEVFQSIALAQNIQKKQSQNSINGSLLAPSTPNAAWLFPKGADSHAHLFSSEGIEKEQCTASTNAQTSPPHTGSSAHGKEFSLPQSFAESTLLKESRDEPTSSLFPVGSLGGPQGLCTDAGREQKQHRGTAGTNLPLSPALCPGSPRSRRQQRLVMTGEPLRLQHLQNGVFPSAGKATRSTTSSDIKTIAVSPKPGFNLKRSFGEAERELSGDASLPLGAKDGSTSLAKGGVSPTNNYGVLHPSVSPAGESTQSRGRASRRRNRAITVTSNSMLPLTEYSCIKGVQPLRKLSVEDAKTSEIAAIQSVSQKYVAGPRRQRSVRNAEEEHADYEDTRAKKPNSIANGTDGTSPRNPSGSLSIHTGSVSSHGSHAQAECPDDRGDSTRLLFSTSLPLFSSLCIPKPANDSRIDGDASAASKGTKRSSPPSTAGLAALGVPATVHQRTAESSTPPLVQSVRKAMRSTVGHGETSQKAVSPGTGSQLAGVGHRVCESPASGVLSGALDVPGSLGASVGSSMDSLEQLDGHLAGDSDDDSAADAKRTRINENFDKWLERFKTTTDHMLQLTPNSSSITRFLAFGDFVSFAQDFDVCVRHYAPIIISELFLDDARKSFRPTEIGGVAGGSKYIIHNILFKLADNSHGIFDTEEDAQKTAAHELKSMSNLFNLHQNKLLLPYMMLVDYKGYRIVAMPLLPVSRETLRFGSDDGGRTMRDDDAVREKVASVASKLYLKEHHVSKDGVLTAFPLDTEIHAIRLGGKEQYVMLDLSRLFPPTTPSKPPRGCHLFRLLRPEFLRKYKKPLSSDGFSAFASKGTDELEAEAQRNKDEIREATAYLLGVQIPRFARDLASIPPAVRDSLDISFLVHESGINVRYLGRVYAALEGLAADPSCAGAKRGVKYWLMKVLTEMITRVLKVQIKEMLREMVQDLPPFADRPFRVAVVSKLNQVLVCASPESQRLWKRIVCGIERKFPPVVFKKTHDYGARLFARFVALSQKYIGTDGRCLLFKKLSWAVGMRWDAKVFSEACNNPEFYATYEPFAESDFIEILPRVKRLGVASYAEGVFSRANAQIQQAQDDRDRMLRNAVSSFRTSIFLMPDSVPSLRNVADCYAMLGKPELAEYFYRKAIGVDAKDSISLYKFALFLDKENRHDQAEEMYVRALEADQRAHRLDLELHNLRVTNLTVLSTDPGGKTHRVRFTVSKAANSAAKINGISHVKDVEADVEAVLTELRERPRRRRSLKPPLRGGAERGALRAQASVDWSQLGRRAGDGVASEDADADGDADADVPSIFRGTAGRLKEFSVDGHVSGSLKTSSIHGKVTGLFNGAFTARRLAFFSDELDDDSSSGVYAATADTTDTTDTTDDRNRGDNRDNSAGQVAITGCHVTGMYMCNACIPCAYADFLFCTRKSYLEAERFYLLALQTDAYHRPSNNNYAVFLATVKKDYATAGLLFERAIELVDAFDVLMVRCLSNYVSFRRNICNATDYELQEKINLGEYLVNTRNRLHNPAEESGSECSGGGGDGESVEPSVDDSEDDSADSFGSESASSSSEGSESDGEERRFGVSPIGNAANHDE